MSRIVGFNCILYVQPSTMRVIPAAMVIIIVVVLGAVVVGHGGAVLVALAVSLLTAAVGEMVRASLYQLRIA